MSLNHQGLCQNEENLANVSSPQTSRRLYSFFYDLFKVSQFRTRMTYKILMSEGTIADYVALRKDILYIEENPGSIPTVLHAASPTDSFF